MTLALPSNVELHDVAKHLEARGGGCPDLFEFEQQSVSEAFDESAAVCGKNGLAHFADESSPSIDNVGFVKLHQSHRFHDVDDDDRPSLTLQSWPIVRGVVFLSVDAHTRSYVLHPLWWLSRRVIRNFRQRCASSACCRRASSNPLMMSCVEGLTVHPWLLSNGDLNNSRSPRSPRWSAPIRSMPRVQVHTTSRRTSLSGGPLTALIAKRRAAGTSRACQFAFADYTGAAATATPRPTARRATATRSAPGPTRSRPVGTRA